MEMTITVTAPSGEANPAVSPCWGKGKEIFLDNLRSSTKHINQSSIDAFLYDNFKLQNAVSNCKALKSKADLEYHNSSGQTRFVGKLLSVLQHVVAVGDPLLQF